MPPPAAGLGSLFCCSDEMWIGGKWLIFVRGENFFRFFTRKQLGCGTERIGLRTPTTGRLPTI